MQEDIEHRSVTLVINTAKMTTRALKTAISKYLAHRKAHAHDSPVGKQTVKELIGQGQGVTNIEITDGNIKSFERVINAIFTSYALKKDVSGEVPRYLVFFKSKDTDALTAAFKEYAAKEVKRDKKPLHEQMDKHKEKVKPFERGEKQRHPKVPER